MYFLINSEQQEILGFTSAYEATAELVRELGRQRANHLQTCDQDEWMEVSSEWLANERHADRLHERSQDQAYRLSQPVFFGLPNGETVVLAEFTE